MSNRKLGNFALSSTAGWTNNGAMLICPQWIVLRTGDLQGDLAMDYAVSVERDREPVKRNLGIRRVLTNGKCAI